MNNRLIDYMSRLNGAESFVDARAIYRDELSSLGITQSMYGCEHNDRSIRRESKVPEALSSDYLLQGGYSIPSRLLYSARGGAGMSKQASEKDLKPHFEYIQLITHTFRSFVQKYPSITEVQSEHDSVLDSLTSNELETVRWLVKGYSIREIANDKLNKSIDMVNKYIKSAKNKMNARNRDQMIARALTLGLV